MNLPLCYVLTFVVGIGLQGLWIGLSFSLSLIALCITLKVKQADWPACLREAQERAERAEEAQMIEQTKRSYEEEV